MSAATMTETTYKGAINKAIVDALAADDDVFFFGEDVGAAGGAFKTSVGIQERFGEKRVLDTPISEQAIVGLAIGAAMRGLRPLAEIMFADFVGVAFDQIANQLAKYRYMTGGQVDVPVTIRMANGASLGFGAQHSQTVESWFLNVTGLVLVAPSTPQDAYSLLRASIQSPDPVLVFEHKGLYNARGPVERIAPAEPLGRAAILRRGDDVTIVATQLMAARALAAADELAARGVEAEVIDLRTLAPMDVDTVLESLGRTRSLVVVQEGPLAGGWASTLVTRVVTAGALLAAPPAVVASQETPVPYATNLETAWLPSVERIVDAASRPAEVA